MSRKYPYQDASENVRINCARQRYFYTSDFHTRHLMREAAEKVKKRLNDVKESDTKRFSAMKLKRDKVTRMGATGGPNAAAGTLALEEAGAVPVGTFGAGAALLSAGLVAVGVGAAAVTNRTLLKDDQSLEIDERESLSVGRKMSYVGGVGGAVGTLGAISASGAVAGLSGAGIVSGITAIGGVIGGGAVVGTVVVATLPALAATGVGYCTYKVYKWFRKGKTADRCYRPS